MIMYFEKIHAYFEAIDTNVEFAHIQSTQIGKGCHPWCTWVDRNWNLRWLYPWRFQSCYILLRIRACLGAKVVGTLEIEWRFRSLDENEVEVVCQRKWVEPLREFSLCTVWLFEPKYDCPLLQKCWWLGFSRKYCHKCRVREQRPPKANWVLILER